MAPQALRKRTRVLHIVQNLNYGGMERLMSEMLRQSDRDRFDNHVLNLQFIGRFGEGLAPYASVTVARPMGRLSLIRPTSLAQDIAAIAPDVVHTHSGVWYKASLAARMAGVPRLVHTEHGRAFPDPLRARLLDAAGFRRTDAIVAVSQSVAERLLAVSRRREKIHVIPNGVDVDAFARRDDDGVLRAELGIPADAPIIGSIGRLEPIKGYEVMVDAYAELRRSWTGPGVPTLVIGGDGSERAALTARAEAAGVGDGIRWLGWRDDVHTLHAAFTLFTMSSHSEGTSISLLEAMSAGLCPVVTDVGGNRAVLGEALEHRLVPPGDATGLAAAWVDALEHAANRDEDSRKARQRITETFTISAMVAAYERLYLGEKR